MFFLPPFLVGMTAEYAVQEKEHQEEVQCWQFGSSRVSLCADCVNRKAPGPLGSKKWDVHCLCAGEYCR